MKPDLIKTLIFIFVCTVICFALFVAGWQIDRFINYKFGYSDQVEETIKKLVKPECLKNP